MNAHESKALADKYHADLKEANRKNIKLLLEQYESIIQHHSRAGRYAARFVIGSYPEDIYDSVIKILKGRGYRVDMNGTSAFTVDWSLPCLLVKV